MRASVWVLSTPGAPADARARALARLGDAALDRAPAGGVDAAAAPLVGAINGRAAYATTSTRAGRRAVTPRRRGGRAPRALLFVSHDGVAGGGGRAAAALAAEATAWPAGERWTVSLVRAADRDVCCATLAARRLVRVCHAAAGARRAATWPTPTVAVRSTGAALDCPLGEVTRDGARHVPSAERLDLRGRGGRPRPRAALDGLARAVASEPRRRRPRRGGGGGGGRRARARAPRPGSALEARGGFDKNFSVAPAGAGGALAIR